MSSPFDSNIDQTGPVLPGPEPRPGKTPPSGSEPAPLPKALRGQEKSVQGPELSKYAKGLEALKTKYTKKAEEPKKPVFKQGLAKGGALRDRLLEIYAQQEKKPLWQVKKYQDKILSEIVPGAAENKWYRLKKLQQEIEATSKRLPHMSSWEAKKVKDRLNILRKVIGRT